MFFAKNEIIELTGGKKHIVVDTTKYNGIYYYYVCEVSIDGTNVVDNFSIITTVSENGCLFVKTIKDGLKEELTNIFKEKLNLE